MTLSRRIASAAVLLGLVLASPAAAQDPVPLGAAPAVAPFGHDDALDGTPGEPISGFYPGDDGVGDPLADRDPLTYEAFEFLVPPGTELGSFTVNVAWQDPRLDFDVYVYRQHPTLGTTAPTAVASSASFGDTDETATYYNAISSNAVEPDRYLIVVDNWCTRNNDPGASFADCQIGDDQGNPVELPDEDDFVGTVTFGPRLASNPLPTVGLAGPDAVKQGLTATFTATAADPGGAIAGYAFDLDGDGRFEVDTGATATVTKRFETAGSFNIGVRVTDNGGGRSYANRVLKVQAPPIKQLVSRFSLNRPVFGGRKRSPLKVTYRVREDAKVTLDLYRGAKRVKRLVDAKARTAGRTYTLSVGAKGRRRGSYTVRMAATTAAGRTQAARVAAKRL
jgi:hypothetical protein